MLSDRMPDRETWKKIEEKYCKKCSLYKSIKRPKEFYQCARCAFRHYIDEYFKKDLDYIK